MQPGEFSLPPHCDSIYGHSVAAINFVAPLTAEVAQSHLYPTTAIPIGSLPPHSPSTARR